MNVREIDVSEISAAVERLAAEANCFLPADVRRALESAREKEQSPLCRDILGDILKNADIAAARQMPICQDTGLAVFFVELGQDVHITGGDFQSAMDAGVARGYTKNYLRKSSQDNVLGERVNRGDNTPAICHIELVPGDRLKITVCPKGGGSENMSAVGMLTPSQGRSGVKKFIVDTVERAGSNPCPPIIIGCAVGGTMEQAALLAKKALMRPLDTRNPDPFYADLEKEMLEKVNALGIGPQGFGGRTTCLGLSIETAPTHVAGLPVAVNVSCHVTRRASAQL